MAKIVAIFQLISLLLQSVSSVGYQLIQTEIHGFAQRIHILTVKSSDQTQIKSALSGDSVFGFESILSMSTRKESVAAVNGMFFDDLGSPAGLLCENGEWLRINDIGTPSLVIEERARIEKIRVKAFLEKNQQKVEVFSYNIGAFHGIANVFTRAYGITNRVYRPQVTYQVVDNQIKNIFVTDRPVTIEEGFLITYLLPDENMAVQGEVGEILSENIFGVPQYHLGEEIILSFQVEDKEGRDIEPLNVYQSGGWLVQKGELVAKDRENFIGYTTSLQPRTAAAINANGEVCFFVVEGRQKGRAEGLSGKWLAEFMLEHNVIDAMYLDGGASSVMSIGGQLVSVPAFSNEKEGKALAHAILIHRFWKTPNIE